MKKTIFTFIFAIFLTSCDFLDIVPQDSATQADMFSSVQDIEYSLNMIYGNIPSVYFGNSVPDWTLGNEVTTTYDNPPRWAPWKGIWYGYENANATNFALWTDVVNGYGSGLRLYNAIRLAWWFVNHCKAATDVDDLSEEDRNDFLGQAYFMIAYYHWVLMEHYGPVVIRDHEITMNEDTKSLFKPRSSWDECSDFVCEMFDKAAEQLPATRVGEKYGRPTSATAKAYKSRVLMYSASPFVNGNKAFANFLNYDGSDMINQTYDREKWKKAMDAAKEAIDLAEANGYHLYEYSDPVNPPANDLERGRRNYYYMFLERSASKCEYLFSNDSYCNALQQQNGCRDWDATVINPVTEETREPIDNRGMQMMMSPTLFIIDQFLTDNGLPLWADPRTKEGYAANHLMSIAPGDSTVLYHRHRDPRFYASVGYDRGYFASNGQDSIVLKMRWRERHGFYRQASYNSCSGYCIQKWVSKSLTYNRASGTISFLSFRLPFMRLAELYLDYAEADFEYDGQLSQEGLVYLNKVRHRCGLPNFEDAWSVAGGMPNGETMRKALHQENLAEFCFEGRAYDNLRRWNVMHNYTEADGMNVYGATAEEFYQITPVDEQAYVRVFSYPKSYWLAIPMLEINTNALIVQNPGY